MEIVSAAEIARRPHAPAVAVLTDPATAAMPA
jgi:hypothetical protein